VLHEAYREFGLGLWGVCGVVASSGTRPVHLTLVTRAEQPISLDLSASSNAPETPQSLGVYRAWVAAVLANDRGARVVLVNPDTQLPRAEVTLPGVRRAHTRIDSNRLLIADDLGRITTIDLATGSAVTRKVTIWS
jgi:hypothetical protein